MRPDQQSRFLSPLTKLVTFFERSRNQWKKKCQTAKRQNKSLRICLAKMKESRDRWKARAMASEEGPKNSRPRRTGSVRGAA